MRMARALETSARDNGSHAPVEVVAYCAGGPSAVTRLFAASSIATRGFAPAEFSYRHPFAYATASRRLAEQFRADRLDLVHGSDLTAAYQAGAAARLASVPFVCHVRSQFPDRMTRRRKQPMRFIDHFVFVSNATWRHFDHLWTAPAERASVVYDWAPVPDNAPSGAAFVRCALSIPLTATVITMVARIAPQKDVATLLAAFAQVHAARPDAHLLLVGDSDPTPAGQAFATACQALVPPALRPHVTWAGFRSDVASVLAASDVVTLVSHGEGVPLVLLEAMSLQRPVVATAIGGIPELVTHGATGLLHRPGDAAHLASLLLHLLNDGAHAAALGRAGQKEVEHRFTRDRAVRTLTGLYERLLGRRSTASAALAVAAS